MLLDLLRKVFFFQNLAGAIWASVPTVVDHNLAKYQAIKKALHITALEGLNGDYVEFGVYTGSSLIFATKAHRRLASLGRVNTRFYGFDSFNGFGTVGEEDKHPFYRDGTFRVDAQRVIRNIKNRTRSETVTIVPGYFEEVLKDKKSIDFGIERSRIVFIDCDLKAPAQLAFDFIEPSIQQGSILIMDDYFAYRGDGTKGVAGAFAEFSSKYPYIQWTRVCDYGCGGVVFIASKVERKDE